MHHTDVHRALSYDRLHYNHGGIWSDHLWVELQKYVTSLGKDMVSQIDKKFALHSLPCSS